VRRFLERLLGLDRRWIFLFVLLSVAVPIIVPIGLPVTTTESTRKAFDFIEALKRLVTPGGYIVVEVPDCSRAMDGCDYTTIWEEHTLYYTPDTFRQTFPFAGLGVVRTENYPYPFENSLVAIATANAPGASPPLPATVSSEQRRGRMRRKLRGRRADRAATFAVPSARDARASSRP